ncbi:hypothetical protein NIES2101_20340 [Calothrix sp. HK-06]|nr:hypothetical protein NIES2101_20340 [Calothrix sp. HK-06]
MVEPLLHWCIKLSLILESKPYLPKIPGLYRFRMYTQNIPELTQILLKHTPVAFAMFDREMRYIAVSRKWLIDYNFDEHSLVQHELV